VTKVLYIEHSDDNRYMLKMRLKLLGDFKVLAAEDSEKGCTLAVTERPDVILMDLEMPAPAAARVAVLVSSEPRVAEATLKDRAYADVINHPAPTLK
jgi:CheY-like chemotaxis protein